MYQVEDLAKYDYFASLLNNNKLEYIIDSLTGAIARKYIIEFVKELINKKIPFTMAILDLDDFKSINDTYGHTVGDYILEGVANDLIEFIGAKGVIGRYGGDEFLFVILNITDYDEIHALYEGIFKRNILRKHYTVDKFDILVTGTIGSASYPVNASNYNDLFLMSDKTLYRGKTKGRNCYIIYVHEKHKDLKIQKLNNDDLPTIMFNINIVFDEYIPISDKLMEVCAYLKETLLLDKIYFVSDKNVLYDSNNMQVLGADIDLSDIKFNNELFKKDYRNHVAEMSFGAYIKNENIASILMTRIKSGKTVFGYIIFALKRTAMIWSEREIGAILFLAKTLCVEYLKNK